LLEQDREQLARQTQQMDSRGKQIDQQQLQLETRSQELEQAQQELTGERLKIEALHKETAREQKQLDQQRQELTKHQQMVEKEIEKMSRLQEERETLLDVKRLLDESEEEMVRRWATGKASEVMIRLALTLVLLMMFSVVVSGQVANRYSPWLFHDSKLELTAVIFTVLTAFTLTVGQLTRKKHVAEKRAIDPHEKQLLEQMQQRTR